MLAPYSGPSERYRHQTIQGSTRFIKATKEALNLLPRGTRALAIVAHVATIRQEVRELNHAGVILLFGVPNYTFMVGRAWNTDSRLYASTIVHEAWHVALYLNSKAACGGREPPHDAWTGTAAERQCMIGQKEALLAMNAPRWMIDGLEVHIANPTHHKTPSSIKYY